MPKIPWPLYHNLTGQHTKIPTASILKHHWAIHQNFPLVSIPKPHQAIRYCRIYQNPTGQYQNPLDTLPNTIGTNPTVENTNKRPRLFANIFNKLMF
jgi:hypothetical protein